MFLSFPGHLRVSVGCRYGAKWESSFVCRLSGFLCVFASQTGLFLLTVAALERCLAAARHNTDGHSGEEQAHAQIHIFLNMKADLRPYRKSIVISCKPGNHLKTQVLKDTRNYDV